MVTAHGGVGIPIKVDHSDESQVMALFERIAQEQNGRLDILINDIGGYPECSSAVNWNAQMWELDAPTGLRWLAGTVHTHVLTNRWGIPLMLPRNRGLIVEVGDGTGYNYRGTFYYSLAKVSVIHIGEMLSIELRQSGLDGITAVVLTPGYMRSEEVLATWGITEEEYQLNMERTGGAYRYAGTESPRYTGRAVVALAGDQNVSAKAGKCLNTGALMKEYGFTDVDGRQPVFDWAPAFCQNCPAKPQ
jgi:NAD(P)-dependent dehydrogenase (short-subunit alcohol dehydrogenase family)